MLSKLPLLIVSGAILALGFSSAALACGGAQLVGFAPAANVDCYSAQAYTLPAAPPAASVWSQEYFIPQPQPQRAYVQQEVLGYAPQPVSQVRVAYATAPAVAYTQAVRTAAVVGFAGNAYATGQPVALRGRFAGNQAVGAVNVHAAQLNTGQVAAVGRERVLRPTLFKRKVAAPLSAGNAVVGAVVVGGY